MTVKAKSAAALLAATLALAGTTQAAAESYEYTYPETPKFNPNLPITHTYRDSDHIKANVLNARPVCNSGEDFRTVVYEARDNFSPVGTISTTNTSPDTIPLTQNLARTQQIALSVNGGYAETTTANIGGTVSGELASGTAGISHQIAKNLGVDISYSLSWTAGQTIGPYDVPPAHTGEATYGFRTITIKGTQQYCKPNGTCSTPRAWSSFAPVKNEVKVKVYDKLADSRTEKGGEANPVFNTVVPVRGSEAPTFETSNEALDLEPRLTTTAGKAEGAAGLVALRVKNVGTERYLIDQTPIRFRVEVGTVEGPEGVDRLITPGWFNGAHARDLGFDAASSTRVFEVTLSNPIDVGEEILVANLNFGDGNTSEGRLINDITVTQIGRMPGDTSTANDWNVNSTDITFTDGGRAHSGRF